VNRFTDTMSERRHPSPGRQCRRVFGVLTSRRFPRVEDDGLVFSWLCISFGLHRTLWLMVGVVPLITASLKVYQFPRAPFDGERLFVLHAIGSEFAISYQRIDGRERAPVSRRTLPRFLIVWIRGPPKASASNSGWFSWPV